MAQTYQKRNKMTKTRRAVELKGMDIVLELSKAATPKTEKEFIHFDKLQDGTWRLLFNVKDAPDITKLEAIVMIREDDETA
jgi:hypothetical protein